MGKGRAPCCDKSKVKQGAWTSSEDLKLTTFIRNHGHDNWRALPKLAGLTRCGKSCRLRWVNYLSPDVKRGNVTAEEEQTIINLHKSFGNKWSKIASYLPGRTDNEIKNVWNTHLKKRIDHKDMISSTSCASSSITLSTYDDDIQNSDRARISEILQEPKNPQPIIEKCNEKPELVLKVISTNPSLGIDAKEPLLNSDSPAYSYESSFSNFLPGHEVPGINSKEKNVEIPLDFDVDDFLQIFNSLDHDDSQSNEANGERVDDRIINPADLSSQGESINNIASELDQSKWLRLVESKLGLINDGNDLENRSNEQQLCILNDFPTNTIFNAVHEVFRDPYFFFNASSLSPTGFAS